MTENPDVIHVDITPDVSRITAAIDRVAARLRFIRRTGLHPDTVIAHTIGEAAPEDRDAIARAVYGGCPQRWVTGADTPEPADPEPCIHCDRPQAGHGSRYAAIPGWHDWTPPRRPTPYPGAAWLPPVLGNQQ